MLPAIGCKLAVLVTKQRSDHANPVEDEGLALQMMEGLSLQIQLMPERGTSIMAKPCRTLPHNLEYSHSRIGIPKQRAVQSFIPNLISSHSYPHLPQSSR